MKIFFDTEFTGLHKNTTLISIGLVDEDCKTFYAEFSDYDKSQCNEWIEQNVLNNLLLGQYEHYGFYQDNTYCCGNKNFIKKHLTNWLSKYDKVELVSDVCHYDMVLFIDIFGDAFSIPQNVNPACHDINQDIARYYEMSETEAFDYSREQILDNCDIKIEGYKHNSLYDAKVIKEIYNVIKSHGLI